MIFWLNAQRFAVIILRKNVYAMKNTQETMMLALAGMTVVLEYGLVLVAALADLWSGLRKARRRGEARCF